MRLTDCHHPVVLALLAIGLALEVAAKTAIPQPPPPPDPGAVSRGREIYAVNCTVCHGPAGRGGGESGTDLGQSMIAVALDASRPGGGQLGAFLKVGRPERRMPAFTFTDADVVALSAFLRATLPPPFGGRGQIQAVVVGDPKAGAAYFSGAGRCATCHAPDRDLKGIGSRLPVATIQGRILVPRGSGGYPPSFLSPPDPGEPQKTVTVTLPSGERISGTLLWITDFHVTFKDGGGVRRTIARRGDVPAVEVVDPLQYHIDHMKTLTDEAMHDLTAYLVSLK